MRKVIGVSIGFCGVILVNVPSDGSLSFHFGIGSLLLLIAAMLYSYGNILAKEGSKTLDVGYMTAYQMIFGSIGLLCIGALQVGVMPFTFSVHAILMLIYIFLIRSRILHLEYNYEVQQGWKSINVHVLHTRIWCVIIEHDFRRSNSFICIIWFSMCSRGNYRGESYAS